MTRQFSDIQLTQRNPKIQISNASSQELNHTGTDFINVSEYDRFGIVQSV
jgi:hypothetical protein